MTAELPNSYVGSDYSETLTAMGSAPITWSIESGSLPAGLTLSGDTISGTPTTAGTSTFSIRAANSGGSDTRQMRITITAVPAAPRITTASLPGGVIGAGYDQTLTASGSAPITWNIDRGSLPAGLILSGDTITGTPTRAGTSTFTIRAVNSGGTHTRQLRITIAAPGFTDIPQPITNPSNGASFTHNGNFVALHEVSLNGTKLKIDRTDPVKFLLSGYPGYNGTIGEAVSGSTIITLYPAFLNTLRNGTHSLMISFMEGQAPVEFSSTFVINRTTTPISPKTGDK